MKHIKLTFALIAIALCCGLGVQAQTSGSITLIAPPPPPAYPVSPFVTGRTGNTIYTYFVITHYPAGAMVSAGQTIYNAPDTLTGSNYVTISWNSVVGASNYDVVRIAGQTSNMPGTCSCAVISATSNTTVNDQGGALGGYILGATIPQAQASLQLNNRDYATPMLVYVPSSASPGGGAGSSGLWSALLAPTGNLALGMANFHSAFSWGTATGATDLFKLSDTTSNTGTGILAHFSTGGGSTVIPFQADVAGLGWQVTTGGALQAVNGTSANIATQTPSNTDLTGRITLAGGSGTYSFVFTYVSAPVCMFEDQTTRTNALVAAVTNTAISISGGTGTDVIKYICIGEN